MLFAPYVPRTPSRRAQKALRAARLAETRLHFERSLIGFTAPAAGLTLVPRARFGRERFAQIFAEAIVGAAEPRWRDLRGDAILERLLALTTPEAADHDWVVVEELGEPVGVALLHPGPGGTGTLLALGLVPSARKRGLGARVHALALARLAQLGSRHYVVGIDGGAVRLRAILRASGCSLRGIERRFGG